ncbi:MAG: hypothetical protein DRI46_10485 [Chloroflexi bacterium]|nr:MAG: hypothetical protein DRI46_10485 [Chloroflexota bacterium]
MTKKRKQPTMKQYGIADNGEEYMIFNRESGDFIRVSYDGAMDMIIDFLYMIPGNSEKDDFRRAIGRLRNMK